MRKWPYSPGDTIKSANDNADKEGLATGENDYDNNSLFKFRKEAFVSFFAPGGALWAITAGRAATMTDGILYAKSTGDRIEIVGVGTNTFPATQDTYVFIDEVAGTKRYASVAVDDVAPEPEENEVLNAIVTTDSANIIEIRQDGSYATHGMIAYPTSAVNTVTTPVTRRIKSRSTITPSVEKCNYLVVTDLATNATVAAPTGTPADGQPLLMSFRCTGSPRTLAWNAIYVGIGVTMPTSLSPGKWVYAFARYNKTDAKYHVLSVGRQP
jgi:hypothetical protein